MEVADDVWSLKYGPVVLGTIRGGAGLIKVASPTRKGPKPSPQQTWKTVTYVSGLQCYPSRRLHTQAGQHGYMFANSDTSVFLLASGSRVGAADLAGFFEVFLKDQKRYEPFPLQIPKLIDKSIRVLDNPNRFVGMF